MDDYRLLYFDSRDTQRKGYNPYAKSSKSSKSFPGSLSMISKDERKKSAPKKHDYVGIVSSPLRPKSIEHLGIVLNRERHRVLGWKYTVFIVRTSRTIATYAGIEPRETSCWKDYSIGIFYGSRVWPLNSKGMEHLGHYFDNIDVNRKRACLESFENYNTERKILREVHCCYQRLRNPKRRRTILRHTANTDKVFNISTGRYLSARTYLREDLPLYKDVWKTTGKCSTVFFTCNADDNVFFNALVSRLKKDDIAKNDS